MTDPFFKKLLKEGHPLAPLILSFNLAPASWIHESWIEGALKSSWFGKLKSSARARRRLSLLILREHGLEGAWCFDFREASRRVALLDGETLERLALFTGIALDASRIAKTIDRDGVLRLKRGIGDDGYRFALKRAPFLLNPGIAPDPAGEPADPSSFREHALSRGMAGLEACLSGEPAALVRRFRLKLPRRWSERPSGAVPEGGKDAWWPLVRKVLLKEVAPEWSPCFS
jgi:hypothetical protein